MAKEFHEPVVGNIVLIQLVDVHRLEEVDDPWNHWSQNLDIV